MATKQQIIAQIDADLAAGTEPTDVLEARRRAVMAASENKALPTYEKAVERAREDERVMSAMADDGEPSDA